MNRIVEARRVFWFLLGFVIIMWAGTGFAAVTWVAEELVYFGVDSLPSSSLTVGVYTGYSTGSDHKSLNLTGYIGGEVPPKISGIIVSIALVNTWHNDVTGECYKQVDARFYGAPLSTGLAAQIKGKEQSTYGATSCPCSMKYGQHVPGLVETGYLSDNKFCYQGCEVQGSEAELQAGICPRTMTNLVFTGQECTDYPPLSDCKNCNDEAEACKQKCNNQVANFTCNEDATGKYLSSTCECAEPPDPCEELRKKCVDQCAGKDVSFSCNKDAAGNVTSSECKCIEPPQQCQDKTQSCIAACGSASLVAKYPTCSIVNGVAVYTECVCKKDQDGDGIPNDQDDDVDNDGIKNGNDDDIDNDGVKNGDDTDPYGSDDDKTEQDEEQKENVPVATYKDPTAIPGPDKDFFKAFQYDSSVEDLEYSELKEAFSKLSHSFPFTLLTNLQSVTHDFYSSDSSAPVFSIRAPWINGNNPTITLDLTPFDDIARIFKSIFALGIAVSTIIALFKIWVDVEIFPTGKK